MKSICETCTHKAQTWSLQLHNEGYIGCWILSDEHASPPIPETAVDLLNHIGANVVSLGWITNAILCRNDQLITLGTRKCDWYKERKE